MSKSIPAPAAPRARIGRACCMRMYARWAERRKYKVEVHRRDRRRRGRHQIRRRCSIKGHNAYGWLKTESGVHRLVRISPFDSNARRHTSFASVWVYPVVDDRIDIEINESDCRIDTYPLVGRRRPARQHDGFGGAHHPYPDRHRRRLPARALAAQEPRHRLEHAARAALRARAEEARGEGQRRRRPPRPISAGATRSAPTCCSPTRW